MAAAGDIFIHLRAFHMYVFFTAACYTMPLRPTSVELEDPRNLLLSITAHVLLPTAKGVGWLECGSVGDVWT